MALGAPVRPPEAAGPGGAAERPLGFRGGAPRGGAPGRCGEHWWEKEQGFGGGGAGTGKSPHA